MKKFYTMKIAGLERNLELFPISDTLNIGAFIMFGDVEITKKCAEELLKRVPEHDIMITAESKGIPLLYEMARQENAENYIVARKKEKVYMKNTIHTDVQSITTLGGQDLCIGENDIEALNGKRVLIVDDVVSRGGSVAAIESLVKQAGGIIVGKACVLAEGDATDRNDIIYLEKLPLFDNDGNPID